LGAPFSFVFPSFARPQIVSKIRFRLQRGACLPVDMDLARTKCSLLAVDQGIQFAGEDLEALFLVRAVVRRRARRTRPGEDRLYLQQATAAVPGALFDGPDLSSGERSNGS
jgi:hypothetical protein